jgi:Fe-S cluster assembly protein SufD
VNDDTLSGEPYFCNDVTEVMLGDAATLEMVRLQKVNGSTRLFTHTNVHQAASSRMKMHYATLGGETVRNNLKVTLAGAKAEHIAGGLSLTQQNEHIDNDVLIVHESPDCQSNQLFRHILSDTSTGAFTGRIVVNKGAQKTVAYQKSSNILLHPKAKMNIRPQLEIYADDVKCSHGATVGQLNAEALFYLRSRGISEAGAKKILLHAFAGEVINQISCESFRKTVLKLTEQKLEDTLTC